MTDRVHQPADVVLPATAATGAPIDVTAWIGGYPFREIPHPDPATLVRVLEREGFGGAWVGHLPGAFHRDPNPSNRALYAALEPHRQTLSPAPMVRPDWPAWERTLRDAIDHGAPAIRIYPSQWGLGVSHPALHELVHACAEAGLVLHVTTRFEDLRQRHPLDGAGDVGAAMLRALVRGPDRPAARVLVAGAGRDIIEETFWGLTPNEQQRIAFDFHWVWGPPDEHFAHLVRTVGPQHLAVSSWWPLRLTQQSRALIELLPDDVGQWRRFDQFIDGNAMRQSAQAAIHSPPP